MQLLREALRAGHSRVPRGTQAGAVVVGGGGALGAALVEQLLGSGHYATVQVVVDEPITAGVRGFATLPERSLAAGAELAGATAFIAFDRARQIFGREAAFHQPQPADLARLGAALRRGGVRRLIVVLPHAPALLPQALRHGLGSLDEQALAALDFDQLVIVRSAQAGTAERRGAALQRLADALLAQLHWMLAQGEQPVRAPKVAAFACALARELETAAPGTRIAPPELVWLAAQPDADVDALLRHWLADGRVPPLPAGRRRW